MTYEKRVFLNRRGHHGGAYIHARLWSSAQDRVGGTVTIADCARTVSLDFDGYDRGTRGNALHKLDVLINTLTEYRAAYVHVMDSGRSAKARRA